MRAVILEESGSFQEICHLCHFVELLIAAFVEVDQRGWSRDSVEAIVLPHWSKPNWRGRMHDHNRVLLERCFPKAVVSTPSEGPAVTAREWVHIDRRTLAGGGIGQPQAKYIQRLDPSAWYEAIQGPIHHSCTAEVTYISRQKAARRRLHPAIHERLVSQLQQLKGIHFREVAMEELDFPAQLELAKRTDVLIGVHGNGLTHAMFMRPKKFVCELFVPGSAYQWHYYAMSRVMGHTYQCHFDGQAVSPASFRVGRPACRSHSLDMLAIIGLIELAKDELG